MSENNNVITGWTEPEIQELKDLVNQQQTDKIGQKFVGVLKVLQFGLFEIKYPHLQNKFDYVSNNNGIGQFENDVLRYITKQADFVPQKHGKDNN